MHAIIGDRPHVSSFAIITIVVVVADTGSRPDHHLI
jgi:hypothetical protein